MGRRTVKCCNIYNVHLCPTLWLSATGQYQILLSAVLLLLISMGQIETTVMMDHQTMKPYIYNENVNQEVLGVTEVREAE